MDFIEGLPKSEGKDTILMVVCKLTKYGYVIPLSHPFTTSIVFKFFVDHVLNYMEHLNPLFLIGVRFLRVYFGRIFLNA